MTIAIGGKEPPSRNGTRQQQAERAVLIAQLAEEARELLGELGTVIRQRRRLLAKLDDPELRVRCPPGHPKRDQAIEREWDLGCEERRLCREILKLEQRAGDLWATVPVEVRRDSPAPDAWCVDPAAGTISGVVWLSTFRPRDRPDDWQIPRQVWQDGSLDRETRLTYGGPL